MTLGRCPLSIFCSRGTLPLSVQSSYTLLICDSLYDLGARASLKMGGTLAGSNPPGTSKSGRHSGLAEYCQLCGKVSEVTLGSDFTHTIVNLSISQLPVAVEESTEPDQGHGVE